MIVLIIRNTQIHDSLNSAQSFTQRVLGTVADTPTPIPIPSQTPTLTPIPYIITLADIPTEITESQNAAFTWDITGPHNVIHTTTIYFGTKSVTNSLGAETAPIYTPYTDSLKDFMQGDFSVPLRFVGNMKFSLPGVYYFRAYALIDGKHLWTEEHTLLVKQAPKHEIKILNFPAKIKSGETTSFTWEIIGPESTTGFTAIVVGKQSAKGELDWMTNTSKTPYTTILVKDFTNGVYSVPLRFVGNSQVAEPGIYFFRATALVNNKNIWSEENSFTVE